MLQMSDLVPLHSKQVRLGRLAFREQVESLTRDRPAVVEVGDAFSKDGDLTVQIGKKRPKRMLC